jgi:hypothetical protein
MSLWLSPREISQQVVDEVGEHPLHTGGSGVETGGEDVLMYSK